MQVILGATSGEERDDLCITVRETVDYFAFRLVVHDRKAEQTLIPTMSPSMNIRVYQGYSRSNGSLCASFDA